MKKTMKWLIILLTPLTAFAQVTREGDANTGLGVFALPDTSTGIHNTAIGKNTLSVNTSGYSNTAIGSDALKLNTVGYFNIAVGGSTLRKNTSGTGNIGLGHAVLAENTNGVSNVAVGDDAMAKNVSGDMNIGIGDDSQLNALGNENTSIGARSLNNLGDGNGNIALGFSSGYYETGSNKLYVDNQQRASESDSKIKSIIYGVMNATVGSQTLDLNALVSADQFILPNSTVLPATCILGQIFMDSDSNDCIDTASGDGALCICKTTNTWALISNF